MIDFILLLIIGSLWIWGVFCAFDEGMIFWPIREGLHHRLPDGVLKPFISCPMCMASVHGGAIGLIYYDFHLIVIPYIICLCGLNFIIKEYLYP